MWFSACKFSSTYYDISITFINRGTKDLENMVIRDIIPEGFNLMEDDMQDVAEDSSEEVGTIRAWTFEMIEAGKEITINYKLQGEGEEYHLHKVQNTLS